MSAPFGGGAAAAVGGAAAAAVCGAAGVVCVAAVVVWSGGDAQPPQQNTHFSQWLQNGVGRQAKVICGLLGIQVISHSRRVHRSEGSTSYRT